MMWFEPRLISRDEIQTGDVVMFWAAAFEEWLVVEVWRKAWNIAGDTIIYGPRSDDSEGLSLQTCWDEPSTVLRRAEDDYWLVSREFSDCAECEQVEVGEDDYLCSSCRASLMAR